METTRNQRTQIQDEIKTLEVQLAAETDTAARTEIQKKITEAQQRLDQLPPESSDPKVPDRPDWQFFNSRELVEMAIVGGGGALGGLIAYIFKQAKIWTFVPPNAGIIHCVGAGALAAGLAVWFIARTDRNNRVPCFLFSILCGLAGLKMIEKAATTILPQVEIFAPAALAEADKNVNAANKASKEVQDSSRPENVNAAKDNIDKVGDSIENLTKALTKATGQGDANAVTVLDKSLSEATQSLAKIKLESQSIPEVAKKAEEVLSKKAPPAMAKNAEQKELDTLKEKYLAVRDLTGWCFLGTYNSGKWDRQTTDYKGDPKSLKGQRLTVANPVYVRNNPPAENYKLGDVINAFFEGDEITVIEPKIVEQKDGLRVWGKVHLEKRAGTQAPSSTQQSGGASADVSPTATQAATGDGSPEPQVTRRRFKKRPR